MITPAQWTQQAWKNGRGVTYEIARLPASGEYDVRVSIAVVERSGAFSTFPGYERWSILAGGAPIELRTAAASHRLAAVGDVARLSGDEAVDATLGSADADRATPRDAPGIAIDATGDAALDTVHVATLVAATRLLNILAKPGWLVGYDPIERDRGDSPRSERTGAAFAIALVDTLALPRWHALLEPVVVPAGCVWIAKRS